MKNDSVNMKKKEFWSDVNRIALLMFLCMIVYNLGHPATPGLIELRGWKKSISGELLATMSTAMFLSSPYLGALGDKVGMKKIFVFMPILYGASQIFLGFSPYLPVVFLARVLAGFGSGGTNAIVYGYMSQISKKEEKTKNIAKVSSMAILGAAMGQKIGGLVAIIDTRYPFGLQFIGGTLVSILSFFVMREIVAKREIKMEKRELNPLSTFRYIKELDKSSKFFCFIIFLAGTGISVYSSALNYFLKFNIKVSSDTIGTFVMFTSLMAFLGTSVILGKLVKRFKEINIYKGMAIIGILLMSIILFKLKMGTVSYLLMSIYAMSYEILKSLGNSIMAKKYKTDQGKILGVVTSVSFLGSATGSLLSGYLLSANMYLPFIVNIIITILVFGLMEKNKKLV